MTRSAITRIILLYVFAIPFVACRYEPPPPAPQRPRLQTRTIWQRSDLSGKRVRQKYVLRPDVLTRCEAGSLLGPDGLVSIPASEFKTTDPIHLSMWLAESPSELQIAMRVLNADDNEIGIVCRDIVAGTQAITMKVGDELKPGRYTLEGFWGGNLVCEKGVRVES
jgi:hypothetical protein